MPGKTEELLVFGYQCKLFRDDEAAKSENQGLFLIPWMGNPQLMIDRYDCRGYLSSQEDFAVDRAAGPAFHSMDEIELEKSLDSERYFDLGKDSIEENILEEEEVKRSEALYDPYAAYASIGYTYSDQDKRQRDLSAKSRSFQDVEQAYLSYCRYYGYDPLDIQVRTFWQVHQCHYEDYERPPPPPEPAVAPEKFAGKNSREAADKCGPEKFIPPEGIVIPAHIKLPETRKMQSIIEKTAFFISRYGVQMEIILKTKQAGNPQFDFLSFGNWLNPYYKYILDKIRDGSFREEHCVAESEKTNKKEVSDSSDQNELDAPCSSNDDDDNEEDELHPLLQAHRRPVNRTANGDAVVTNGDPVFMGYVPKTKHTGKVEDLRRVYMTLKYRDEFTECCENDDVPNSEKDWHTEIEAFSPNEHLSEEDRNLAKADLLETTLVASGSQSPPAIRNSSHRFKLDMQVGGKAPTPPPVPGEVDDKFQDLPETNILEDVCESVDSAVDHSLGPAVADLVSCSQRDVPATGRVSVLSPLQSRDYLARNAVPADIRFMPSRLLESQQVMVPEAEPPAFFCADSGSLQSFYASSRVQTRPKSHRTHSSFPNGLHVGTGDSMHLVASSISSAPVGHDNLVYRGLVTGSSHSIVVPLLDEPRPSLQICRNVLYSGELPCSANVPYMPAPEGRKDPKNIEGKVRYADTENIDKVLSPPLDLLPVIDRLALYVARNGETFEAGIRSKMDPRFDFLNSCNPYYAYYQSAKKRRIAEVEEKKMRGKDGKNSKVSFGLKAKTTSSLHGKVQPVQAVFNQIEDSESDEESRPSEGFVPRKDRAGTKLNVIQSRETGDGEHLAQKLPAEQRAKWRSSLSMTTSLTTKAQAGLHRDSEDAAEKAQRQDVRKKKAAAFVGLLRSNESHSPASSNSSLPSPSDELNESAHAFRKREFRESGDDECDNTPKPSVSYAKKGRHQASL